MADRTLYHMPACPYCEMVRLALTLERLPWESVVVDREDRSRVEDVSGQSGVPVLVHDGTAISDSAKILRHLASRDGSRLIPVPRRDQTLMALLVNHVDQVLAPLCRARIRASCPDDPENRSGLVAELQALDRLLERGDFLFGTEPSIADIRAGAWLIRMETACGAGIPQELGQVRTWMDRLRKASTDGLMASGGPAT